MISFEDFLLRPSKVVDPFNRFVARIDPFLTLVEFCQVIGPKPLAVVSKQQDDKTTGVDINEMAIWLMSSDTVPGTMIVLENNQTGIHAAAYYFNLYDMRARAFQRNLCIAYLSSEKPSKETLHHFSTTIKKLVSPVLICNRRLFIRHVTDIVKFSDNIDEKTLKQYYTLNGDSKKLTDSSRFNIVFEQTRLLKSKFLTKRFQEMKFEDDICCGHNTENMTEAEDIICSFRVPSIPLSPIETLTPCAYSSIIPKLRKLCFELDHSTAPSNNLGSLFCGRRPIASVTPYTPSTISWKTEAGKTDNDKKGEETLKAITGHIGDLLFPLLCGEDMVVCGADQRKTTVEDMLGKLNQIIPKESTHCGEKSLKIMKDPAKIESGLGGLLCNRNETGKLARWRNILDMNRCVLKAFTYDGTLLNGLNKKRKFPSDRSLVLFIIAYLTRICQLTYVCRYMFLRSPNLIEKAMGDQQKISADDEKILVNLLMGIDFEKFNQLKLLPNRDGSGVKPSRTINL
uniref:UDENN FLCN/SMCR8-type domain-containing protein n=1 Tax=Caenorhabditis tropicalis TaxID=1561998 RepID=A0A1I7U366_9PELO